MAGIDTRVTEDSSLSGGSATTYSPKSSSHVGTSSSFGISSNSSGDAINKSVELHSQPQVSSWKNNICMKNRLASAVTDSKVSFSLPCYIDKTGNSNMDSQDNSQREYTPGKSPLQDNSQVDSLQSPMHNQSEEMMVSQDDLLYERNEKVNPNATSTPFIHAIRKEHAHFNSLQLSCSESTACNSNLSNPLNQSKPVIFSSPSDIVEKKLEFSFPSGEGSAIIPSEKSSDTLDIPMWCKEFEECDEITKDESDRVLDGKSANVYCEMESGPFNEVVKMSDQLSNIENEESKSLNGDRNSLELPVITGTAYSSNSVPDIFDPVDSQIYVKTSDGSQKNDSTDSVYENLPEMDFGLSQETSQVSANNSECFTSLENKNDLTKEEVGLPQKASCSKEIEHSSLSEESKYEMGENSFLFKQGMQVFALWNKIYYPGIVKNIDDSASLTVHFHDDQIVTMPKKNVFTHNLLTSYGQQCKVKLVDEYYHNALVMASWQHNNYIYYTVLVNGEHTTVGRNSICFTQIQKRSLLLANIDKGVMIPNYLDLSYGNQNITRKRRKTEPVLSSSSENLFIARHPAKKYKHIPQKLFEGITMCIIPDDAPALCPRIINFTSSTEEEEELEYIPFNSAALQKIIEDNGGVVIPKLYGRELQRARKIICIAKSFCTSLQFIYAVVVGIPVLHFDWVHRSVEAKCVKSHQNGEYVLQAGIDVLGNAVEQNISIRDSYTPLNLLRFYVHMDGEIKNQNRLLDLILYKCGSERLFSCMHVTKKTKKIPFDMKNIDLVLTLVDHVPRALVDAAEKASIKIVTSTWFVQCLINNQLLDILDCPVFRYSEHPSSIVSDTSKNIIINANDNITSNLPANDNEGGSPEFN